jgi:hypothetical protein
MAASNRIGVIAGDGGVNPHIKLVSGGNDPYFQYVD